MVAPLTRRENVLAYGLWAVTKPMIELLLTLDVSVASQYQEPLDTMTEPRAFGFDELNRTNDAFFLKLSYLFRY